MDPAFIWYWRDDHGNLHSFDATVQNAMTFACDSMVYVWLDPTYSGPVGPSLEQLTRV